jgi:hypothetical protein
MADEAMLRAQARGLQRVLVVPWREVWFEPRDAGVLLVSRGARNDRSSYVEALDAFD